MFTRAQGLFAHAATPGAPTIIVTQAKAARYKNICASGPENVCTLLAASPTKSTCWQPAIRRHLHKMRRSLLQKRAGRAGLSASHWGEVIKDQCSRIART